MKEGWTLAVCEYKKVTLNLKHLHLVNSLSEAILCPLFVATPYPGYFVSLVSEGNFQDTIDFSQVPVHTIRDFSCFDLPASRLVCPMLPAQPSEDEAVKMIKTGLEVCNSLGCSTVSIPLPLLDESLERSAVLLLESVENYVLGNLDQSGIKEINICCCNLEELQALNQASRFRMTRYESFVCLGMPDTLPASHKYCFDCDSISGCEVDHDELHMNKERLKYKHQEFQ
jgi:hypothetical protein